MHSARTTTEYMDELFARKRRRENPQETEVPSTSQAAYAVYTSGLAEKIRVTMAEFLESTADATPVESTKGILSAMAVQMHLNPGTTISLINHIFAVHGDDISNCLEKGTDKKKSTTKPPKDPKEAKDTKVA